MDWTEVINNLVNTVVGWVSTTGIKIVVSLLILLIAFRTITVVTRRIEKRLWEKHADIDKTLTNTLFYILRLALKFIVVACLIGYLGIDTSAIASLIASLGVCVGLAVNGALSNLAGGVLIVITRPFRIDDYIEAQGYSGTVEEIRITQTKLRTPDNKTVYIPNGPLSSGAVINYSMRDTRRVDFTFSIGYADDFERAKAIITEIADGHELVLKDPAPFVRVGAHGQSSIDIVCRVWVKSADYWTVNFDMLESVKAEFDKQGIEIPFNQLDVHVKND
jgi:small conductance mechanosensitive channel